MSKEMSRETLLRLGWVNIKTINLVAPSFAKDIRIHLREDRVQHALNTDGYRQTNWYRLTPRGKAWIYNHRDNWAAKAFKVVPHAELEVGRNELWKKGWMAAFPSVYNRYTGVAEELGLLEVRPIKRRFKNILYVRMTREGERFYADFLKARNRLGLRRALSKVRTEKSRRKLRREFNARLEDTSKANISYFLHDCVSMNVMKRSLNALARELGVKI